MTEVIVRNFWLSLAEFCTMKRCLLPKALECLETPAVLCVQHATCRLCQARRWQDEVEMLIQCCGNKETSIRMSWEQLPPCSPLLTGDHNTVCQCAVSQACLCCETSQIKKLMQTNDLCWARQDIFIYIVSAFHMKRQHNVLYIKSNHFTVWAWNWLHQCAYSVRS